MRVELADVPHALRPLRSELTAAGHELVDSEPEVLVLGVRAADGDEGLLAATYGVYRALTETSASGVVLLGSTRVYDSYDRGWRLSEDYAPRPTPELGSLAPYLAELTARELAREGGLRVWLLRLDDLGAESEGGFLDPEDAVIAITEAVGRIGQLGGRTTTAQEPSFAEMVISGDTTRFVPGLQDRSPFRWAPGASVSTTRAERRDPLWPRDHDPVRVGAGATRVTVYGAGGPMGVAVCEMLRALPGVTVTASDLAPLSELSRRPPQSPGAPLPTSLPAPHREVIADVTDYRQVLAAAHGADCLVNVSVVRDDPALAFRVNTLGSWHIARAAAELGIPRVVQTGPTLVLWGDPVGLGHDRDVPADAPARPGRWVYGLSKMLGLEVCRVLAEHHRMANPQLLFNQLLPDVDDGREVIPFAVTWRDAGRAVAAATQVDQWPQPSTRLDVLVPSPHGRTQYGQTWRLLGIDPLDRQDRSWRIDGR